MKLLKLKLENYRRFIGVHEIEFADDQDKNVTIIRAQNGAGKTGILMALLFGLFGIVKYDQFQIENDDDVMVSRSLLSLGKSATAKVEIEFYYDNSKYKITREVTANNLNNKVHQDNSDVKVRFYKGGLDQYSSREEIDSFMDNLIGENIRSFLFFDGVRYMDLFKKPTRESKKELKKIIEKMLNIDDLDKTTRAIQFLKETLIKTTNDIKLNTEKKVLMNKKLSLENQISNYEDKIIDFEKRNETYHEYKKKYDERVKNNSEYEDSIKKLNDFKIKLNYENENISICENTIKRESEKLFTDNILYYFGNEVRSDFDSYSIENSQTISLVDSILQSNKCICCDEPLNDDKIFNLKRLLVTMQSRVAKGNDDISIISSYTLRHINNSKNSDGFFQRTSKQLEKAIEIRDTITENIAKINDEIPLKDIDELVSNQRDAIRSYSEFIAKIELANSEINKLRDQIERLEEDKNEINDQIRDIDRQIADINNEKEKFDVYENSIKKLYKLKEEYLEEAQNEISERANVYFMKLLSNDDRVSINNLKINKDYQIEAYNNFGQEVFSDLSAGQKLLASMAFTMGLTAVAADAKPTTNFPLVMDTPMSNLDKANRERLIKIMPEVVVQWILTPMDTELTNAQISVFDETNRVGKIYSLIKNNESSVIVEHRSLSEYEEVL